MLPPLKRVLVIDDEEPIRRLIRLTLERDGVDVTEATDGHAAIELARDRDFDAVVLDWKMPGPSGPEVLDELKKRRPDLPVLMLTAELDLGRGGLAYAYGADDFLAKPFKADELRASLARLLG
jgi:two-component system response regulator ResD